MHIPHNIGIASQIGKYTDAMEVSGYTRWLFTSGTPGLDQDGNLPGDICAQADLAWRNILRMLESSSMTIADIVKVTHYLTRESDIAEYVKIRSNYLGDARPASMLMIIPALVKPDFLVEIEVIAAQRYSQI
ncbi:RidA family protein [Undibacterium pigrum]|uniref:Enamine deaminase RidA (YjgF/YER057c/UK114 family) n=1 Tax=Undibacterium pigrum TaxID=401470 RepID=A0A318ISG7_9BURK|nr:Rid family hydrolase [Undibacterium pigrum]PXX37321.1 enamine deaminase RidA (YjgF/YER057c/UK114 family) [Undibacterium pigrum]